MQNALKYIGNGAFIPDLGGELVPARDLTADEVAHFGEAALLASGLYVRPKDEVYKKHIAATLTSKSANKSG